MAVTLKIHVEPLPAGIWADGNRVDAFEEMYRRCYPQVVDLCRRNLCGRGDPEAIAQEAFVRAWSSMDRFTGARPFWPWVATIARRLCIDHRRRLDRESSHLHVEATAYEQCALSPDEVVDADQEYRAAVAALRALKPSEQRVIALREINGWSYGDIARFEGVTIESIRSSLKRARASLRKSYAKVAAGAPAALGMQRLRSLRGGIVRSAATVSGAGIDLRLGLGSDIAVGLAAAALALLGAAAPIGAGVVTTEVSPAAVRSSEVHATADEAAGGGHPQGVTTGSRAPAADKPAGDTSQPPLLAIPPDGGETPEDSVVNDLTPSPSYVTDRTVFGVGTVSQGCAYGPCAALFRSTDRGSTWQRLPGEQFVGGTVLLPQSFPRDPRIFVAGPVGLQVSDDDGKSFRLLAALVGDAAISPAFSAGDDRILIGHAPVWEYRDDMETATPSGVVLPSPSGAVVPHFSPGFDDDGVIFFGATTATTNGSQASVVFRCMGSSCERSSILDGLAGSPLLAASPVADVVVTWRGDRAFVSHDHGRTFAPVRLPLAGSVRDVSFAPDGRLFVAVRSTAEGAAGGLLASNDNGASWDVLGASTELAKGVEAVVAPSTSRIIAAGSFSAGGGVLCSSDGGSTWGRRCDG